MKLSELAGSHILSGIETGIKELDNSFYWVDGANYVKFTIDGITYMAVEDPDDGYRSYMSELKQIDGGCRIKIPNVNVVCHTENSVLVFVDATNGQTILELGTNYSDLYYPYCVMNYYPEKMSCNSIDYDSLFQ